MGCVRGPRVLKGLDTQGLEALVNYLDFYLRAMERLQLNALEQPGRRKVKMKTDHLTLYSLEGREVWGEGK